MRTKYTTLISVEELSALRSSEDIVLLDCRFYLMDTAKGRKEYMQSHIPGAIYLDINHDLSSPVIRGVTGRHPLPKPQILEATLISSGLNNKSQVVVYDQSNGAYASRAWWLLRWLGHKDVAVLNGGFKAWTSKDLPVDNMWTLPLQGNFKADLQENMTVYMESLGSLHNPLVDSREYTRYSGEHETIDPIAGHIPGAVCVPYLDNTFESGEWKNKEELKKKFSAIELASKDSPVFYCGSGITACHNILAYKIATGKDSKLYPGSWSEWINHNKVKSEK
ncbi:MAG: sulfurtransferase [Saprospiraceae bacterium]